MDITCKKCGTRGLGRVISPRGVPVARSGTFCSDACARRATQAGIWSAEEGRMTDVPPILAGETIPRPLGMTPEHVRANGSLMSTCRDSDGCPVDVEVYEVDGATVLLLIVGDGPNDTYVHTGPHDDTHWLSDRRRYRPRTAGERLGYLVEECREVLAAAGKSLRWGLDSVNPELSGDRQETNAQWLARELVDLQEAIRLMLEHLQMLNLEDV